MTTPTGPSLVGLTVDYRYDITERVAHGGMATVYRAMDTRLDREVALKILRPNMADDPSVIDKFQAEAKNTAKINHPHVINVYDQGVGPAGDGHVAYLAMEFIAGHTLREVLRANGPMTVEETWNIALPIIRGVAAAHRVGLIHRDIKPENVLVSSDGDIKVVDFGLARAASNHTGTGMALMGTVAYMSPELVTGQLADERSDVYALGILIFEMLTGQRPYTGDSVVSIAMQHTNSRVPAPSTLLTGISPAVDDIILHMTEPSPEDRPANASEVLILIRHLLENPTAAEELAKQQPSDNDATKAYEPYDAEATVPFAAVQDELTPPRNTAVPPQKNVTILPPAVTAEAAYSGTIDAVQPIHEPNIVIHRPKEAVREFAPLNISRAAIRTLIVVMLAAVTVLLGNWVGTTLMHWIFG